MQITNPIIHNPPGGKPNKTYEYVLPVTKDVIHAEHRPLLPTWFERFLDKNPPAVKDLLSSDWEYFNAVAAEKLRDYLLSLVPKSIVIDGDRIWLALHSNDKTNPIMIHEPRKLASEQIEFVRSFDNDSLEIFCTHFYDAFEDVTPYISGPAMYVEPVTNESFPKCGDWANGIYVYYISNGDAILMAPDGRVGR